MKIYLAGNTPDRLREEKTLLTLGLTKRRLIAYHYLIVDAGVKAIWEFWTK